MRTYSETRIVLEDYEWRGLLCRLTVNVEFSQTEGLRGDEWNEAEPGETELGTIEVVGALMGDDQEEACPRCLSAIQAQLSGDPEALESLRAQCEQIEA